MGEQSAWTSRCVWSTKVYLYMLTILICASQHIELRDPRAVGGGIVFLAYDAGGHDEYQEMLQSFFTPDTLYILVWNVALPDSESGTTVAKMEEQQQ